MKLNKVNVLVTKVDLKQNQKGEAYVLIDLLDMESGDSFNIISKDLELMKVLNQMNKYEIDLNLSSSRFGLRLEIDRVNSNLGEI
ncbi:hypothetical protein [Caproiciproducens sp. MSJ-32]|uniref:hypothetical protein n=1 Tax=Caproiciproducens sp. MSJ-32 TaxID=2841527 RepID=UPI001C127C18|nr:hypothetical protein [Caproiciproducens sp. MSJ-32]MBU5453878.1 hypothetical protein [Caproiciproducens sp. MSJ-32]